MPPILACPHQCAEQSKCSCFLRCSMHACVMLCRPFWVLEKMIHPLVCYETFFLFCILLSKLLSIIYFLNCRGCIVSFSSDLIRWKAYLRVFRCCIDFGVMIVRLVLWIQYGAITSVFLIKNMYNLLHGLSQIERYLGCRAYPLYTVSYALFTNCRAILS